MGVFVALACDFSPTDSWAGGGDFSPGTLSPFAPPFSGVGSVTGQDVLACLAYLGSKVGARAGKYFMHKKTVQLSLDEAKEYSLHWRVAAVCRNMPVRVCFTYLRQSMV